MTVDARHIRTLRPQRDARMAIYWLGEPDDEHELEAMLENACVDEAAADSSSVASQLTLFERVL
jgi:hypothetical protein